jgi:hypothetical protein
LVKDDGSKCENKEEIKHMARAFYMKLFSSEPCPQMDAIMEAIPRKINQITNEELCRPTDANLRPTDVNFNRMSIWVRIQNLPFGLMNKTWGEDLARKIGSLEKVDVDDQGRAW